MIFPFILVLIVVAPIAAVFFSARDRQLMAPAVGALDPPSRFRGDVALRGAPGAWRALWPLVRVEAVRLAQHPAPYLVALPLCALSLANLNYPPVIIYGRDDVDLIIFLVPLAWGTLIASNLLTLRSRRWHSEELLATTPTPQRSRTVAHLLACLVMVPVAAAMLVVALGLGALSGRTMGSPRPWVLVAAVLLVVGGGVVGVAVARWLPRPGMGWVAVIATLLLQLNFGYVDPRWRWLHFSMYGNETIAYPELASDHHLVHAAYLVAGIVLVAAVALARDGLDARTGALLAGACAVLMVTAVVQVRPATDAEAAKVARRLQDPAEGQVCSQHDGFTICADHDYLALVPHWNEPVAGVLRRAPAGARVDPLVVRQRPTIEARTALATEVAERVDPAVAWPDDGEVSLSNRWALPAPESEDGPGKFQLSLAFRTASALMGLPPDAWWSQSSIGSAAFVKVPLAEVGDEISIPLLGPLVQCASAGEARTVAAIWLAGQSTPAARAELHLVAGQVLAHDLLDAPIAFDAIDNYGALLPSVIPEQGAVPTGADLVAATALLARDDAEVAAVLHAHWPELTGSGSDSGSGSGSGNVRTAELLSWFGIDEDDARTVARAAAPAPDPDPHPEDMRSAPAITGPCPASRR